MQECIEQGFVFVQSTPSRGKVQDGLSSAAPQDSSAKEYGGTQGGWLPIGALGRCAALVKAEQIEGKENGKEG